MKHTPLLWKICNLFFLFLSFTTTHALHLTGGEITYDYIGQYWEGYRFDLTVKIYKDCDGSDGNTPFPVGVGIAIFDAATLEEVRGFAAGQVDSSLLPTPAPDSCSPKPNATCYTVGTYKGPMYLQPNDAGYYLVWSQCCRNVSITNLLKAEGNGIVLMTFIPPVHFQNNSPRFTNLLPAYICKNKLFTFRPEVEDPDGDSLAYEISPLYTAGSIAHPSPPSIPPPQVPLDFLFPNTYLNPIPGNPALEIHPKTGTISIRPIAEGRYVFGMLVKEYRQGHLIGTVMKDIQINVVDCITNLPPFIIRPDSGWIVEDTLFFERGKPNCFTFSVNDQNGPGVPEDQLSIFAEGEMFRSDLGATFLAEPGLSPIQGILCWTPPCELEALSDPRVMIKAQDSYD
ncbi:MAG: hypothetical protein KDE26_12260, partial [Bacteroidetes bacterium]|nr:hypothetical protein [Bacteroidota bacterium]